MTNILDAVEPDWWDEQGAGPFYSRETVESLLEAHREQVLLEAAEFCDTQYERDKPNQEAGGQDNSDGYVSGYVDGSGDSRDYSRDAALSNLNEDRAG
jgi:hypothetical protein